MNKIWYKYKYKVDKVNKYIKIKWYKYLNRTEYQWTVMHLIIKNIIKKGTVLDNKIVINYNKIRLNNK